MPLTPPESNVLAGVLALISSPGIVALVMHVRKGAVDDETLKQVPVQVKALEDHKADDRRIHEELRGELRQGFGRVGESLARVEENVKWLREERRGQ